MKLFGAAALVLGLAVGGQAAAQTRTNVCQFNSASALAEIDIPRVKMEAADLPIAYEAGFSEADLKFAWGEVIANNSKLQFGDLDATGQGIVFTRNGPALGATVADGKPVWRFAPAGSACEEIIVSRDITSSGPSSYDFGGIATQGDMNYTLWVKKTASRYETVLIAMKGPGKPTLTRIATLPVEAKAISVRPAQNGTVDLIMVAAKPRDRASYLFALNYKPK